MEEINELKELEMIAIELSKNVDRINKAIENCRTVLNSKKVAADYRLTQILNIRKNHLMTERGNAVSDLAKIKTYAESRNYVLNLDYSKEDFEEQVERIVSQSVEEKQVTENNSKEEPIVSENVSEEVLESVEEEQVIEDIQQEEQITSENTQIEVQQSIKEDIPQERNILDNNVTFKNEEVSRVDFAKEASSTLPEDVRQAMASFEEDYLDYHKAADSFAKDYLDEVEEVKETVQKQPIKIPDFIKRVEKTEKIENIEQVKQAEKEKVNDIPKAEEKPQVKIPDFIKKVEEKQPVEKTINTPNVKEANIKKIEVQQKDVDPNKVTISDFSCIYKNGKYIISVSASKAGHKITRTKKCVISAEKLLNKKAKEKDIKLRDMDPTSEIYKNLDYNLFSILSNFDKGFKTNYATAYKEGRLGEVANITYDFSGKEVYEWERKLYSIAKKQHELLGYTVIKPNGNIYKKQIKPIKQNNEKLEENKNIQKPFVSKIKFNKETIGTIAATAALALVIATPVGTAIHKMKDNNKKQNKYKVETQNKGIDNTFEETTNFVMSKGVLISENVNKVMEEQEELARKQEEREKAKKASCSLGVGESLLLTSRDEDGKVKYTHQLSKNKKGDGDTILASEYDDCNRFVINSMTVIKDNEELTTVENKDIRTDKLYEEYGDGINILLGFTAYKDEVEKHKDAGYLLLEDFGRKRVDANGEEIKTEESTENDRYSINDLEKTTEVEKEEATTEQKTTEVEKEEVTTESNTKNENTTTEEYKEKDYASNENYSDLDLNGRIKLVSKDSNGNITQDTKLTSDAWGGGKSCYASELDCADFEVDFIAVFNGKKPLDVIMVNKKSNVNDIINKQYQKYGKDVEIGLNFRSYENEGDSKPLYERIGWVNIKNIKTAKKQNKEQLASSSTNVTKSATKQYKK